MKKLFLALSLSTLLTSSLLFATRSKDVKAVNADSDYYASINTSMKGDTLKVALYNIIKKDHVAYGYNTLEVAMKITDRDYTLSPLQENEPDDYDPYMRLLYADYNGNTSTAKTWKTSQGKYGVSSGYVWNKEHIWAKSNGFPSEGADAYSDLHHLRASDWKCNNTRSNYPFGNVSSKTTSNASYDWTQSRRTDNYLQNGVFEPRDSDKGDVARALFYMATRYYNGEGSTGTHLTLTTGTDSSGGKWGYLDTLLEWHEQDPVDEFESNRNRLVQTVQGNRNPYIDHPEYARAVFKNEAIVVPDTLINLTYTGTPTKTEYKQGESFNPSGITVTATYRKNDNSTYTSDVTSYVTWSPLTKTSTSVTGTYSHGGVDKTITINGISVISLESISFSGKPNKTVYEEGDTFVHDGLKLYAHYSDSSSEDVTSLATWPTEPLTKGQMSISVSFGGLNLTYTGIHVKEKAASTSRIKFLDHASDDNSASSASVLQSELESGADIATVSSASNVYKAKTGVKFASGKNAGSLTFTLKKATDVTKLVFGAKKYGSDSTTVTVTTSATSGKTFTPGSDVAEYTIDINKSITTITVSSPSGNRFYLSYVDVYSGSGGSVTEDAITQWGIDYLFIGDSAFDGDGTGLCISGQYYHSAKVALMALESTTSGTISKLQSESKYSSECARYLAWAKANQDANPFVSDYSFLNNLTNENLINNENSTSVIVFVVVITTLSAISLAVLVIRKRKAR